MVLTEEQQMVRDAIHDYARERLAPFAAEWDRNATFPPRSAPRDGPSWAFSV